MNTMGYGKEDDDEYENTWQLFYNGTALQYPVESQLKLIKMWESTIITGLRYGVTIETQKQQIKEDLDEMEKYIFGLVGKIEYTNEDIKKKIGEKDYQKLLNKWGLNVVCGLKLKVFSNDNNNGHSFMIVKK
jgi:hypothetical protein